MRYSYFVIKVFISDRGIKRLVKNKKLKRKQLINILENRNITKNKK
jgi:hypothetical protein